MIKIKLFFLTGLCLPFFILSAQISSFPGAEGHGRYTIGGRGGAVYYVTNLTDDNTGNSTTREGSLRWCVGRSGARTILFKVSGTIFLNSELKISNNYITIAGQSAPGDGICIAGYPVVVSADQVIFRFLRFRMGRVDNDLNTEGADALGGRFHKNIMVDHCSVSWSTDECCSFYQNTDFTLQWCIISESLNMGGHPKGEHGYGGIWGGFGASFHHNLMAHHKSRVPRLGPGANTTPDNELCDIRNNVYYNYKGEGCYGAEAMHANIVNNYYDPGPAGASLSSTKKMRIIAIDKKIDNSFPAIDQVWGDFYIDGNYIKGQSNATRDNWTYGVYNQINSKYSITQVEKDTLRLSQPLPVETVTTHAAENAYEKVLLYAGCSLHRDAIDLRIVDEARNKTATFKGDIANLPGIIDSQNDLKPSGAGDDWSAWPELVQGDVPADTDRDGIPDGWLEANYPGKTAAGLDETGYTYLELYLNALVGQIVAAQNKDALLSATEVPVSDRPLRVYQDGADLVVAAAGAIIRRLDVYDVSGRQVHASMPESVSENIRLAGHSGGFLIVRVVLSGRDEVCVSKIACL